MRILLTGASGFLGKNILAQLQDCEVLTISRSSPGHAVDLSITIPNIPECELVIHAAGKAHSVPKTEEEKNEFFRVNVTGTENLLKGLENCPAMPKRFVFISSVAVYGRDTGQMINELTDLAAVDPYGLSKIYAEQIVWEWCKRHEIICTILRLPLLAGKNPPGNLKSMILAIKRGYYFDIGGGKANKSIVMVNDVAKIIQPASRVGGIFNLTDGVNPTFSQLAFLIAKQHNKRRPINISYRVAKILAIAGDLIGRKAPINTKTLKKIVTDLTFDDAKAKSFLGWCPAPVLENFDSTM